ncbi:hypothetical protein FIBSPDRAFT_886075 [Athelia psychrophila]|uniref:Uncharacterized protein n=1 Tax=Athelia psychrophila TaxID=1759441 RepID=A0A166R2U5_9AGAM|nr:hypothetical protein FIBSPDRAFT_886075 [Fibularhizoctonia sp. CBS 109695]
MSPPPPPDTLLFIKEQIRQLEATREREKIADAKKLKREKEDMLSKFSGMNNRMAAFENEREQQEAEKSALKAQWDEEKSVLKAQWGEEKSVLKAQLGEEKALRNSNLVDLNRAHYRPLATRPLP